MRRPPVPGRSWRSIRQAGGTLRPQTVDPNLVASGVGAADFVIARHEPYAPDGGARCHDVGLNVVKILGPEEELTGARRMTCFSLMDADRKVGRPQTDNVAAFLPGWLLSEQRQVEVPSRLERGFLDVEGDIVQLR